jgi:hypothetical protein
MVKKNDSDRLSIEEKIQELTQQKEKISEKYGLSK